MLDKPGYINVGGILMDLSVPKVMGIVNITPDSFYQGSRATGSREIIEITGKMIADGADIIDVGGYSSRPGAENISAEEEKSRVTNALHIIRSEFPGALLSVDTFRSEIAYTAVNNFGVQMINDISGGEGDPRMFDLVTEVNVPYIIMHMQGTPATMQLNPYYDDVVADILKWFSPRIYKLQSRGVKDLILDPGFGFGKTIKHSFEMLRRLNEFSAAGLPLLVGLSRKSMIWKTLSVIAEDALTGTTVLNTIALMNGADILRVHDVGETVQVVTLIKELLKDNLTGEDPK